MTLDYLWIKTIFKPKEIEPFYNKKEERREKQQTHKRLKDTHTLHRDVSQVEWRMEKRSKHTSQFAEPASTTLYTF